jgi:hypothetical protein
MRLFSLCVLFLMLSCAEHDYDFVPVQDNGERVAKSGGNEVTDTSDSSEVEEDPAPPSRVEIEQGQNARPGNSDSGRDRVENDRPGNGNGRTPDSDPSDGNGNNGRGNNGNGNSGDSDRGNNGDNGNSGNDVDNGNGNGGNGNNDLPPASRLNSITEVFNVSGETPKLDLLVITDNSSSMREEQKKMGERFSSLISDLGDIDWQVGVTTTDNSDADSGTKGELLPINSRGEYIIKPSTPNANAVFSDVVQREEEGTVTEEPLRATILALQKRRRENSGFIRDDASLAVLVLSDEDEKSDGSDGATEAPELINFVRSELGEDKEFKGFGIIVLPGDSSCRKKQDRQQFLGAGAEYGIRVADLASRTGGLVRSICENNYSRILGEISRGLSFSFKKIKLAQVPVGRPIVTLSPYSEISYTVEGNEIIFDRLLPRGVEISVSYKYE